MSRRSTFSSGLPLAMLIGISARPYATAAEPSSTVVAAPDKDNKATDPDNDGTSSKTEFLDLVKKLFKQADAGMTERLTPRS